MNNYFTQSKIDKLIKNLSSQEPETMESAIYQLGQLKERSKKATIALINLLNSSSDDEICWAVIESLGKIGTEESIPHLINCLRNPKSTGVRQAAAKALNQIGSAPAISDLIECINNPQENFFVQKEAAMALKNFTEQEKVRKALKLFLEKIPPLNDS